MKAVIVEAYGEPLVVSEVEELPLGAHELRLHTGASGVCHSDLSIAKGEYPAPVPLVLGHEGVGTVVEVGEAVTGARPGDRVIGTFVPACGTCWQCQAGRSHCCDGSGRIGDPPRVRRDGVDIPSLCGLGTMAESMRANEVNVVKVETDLPDDQLALIGCGVTTGVGAALWTAEVKPGSSVAVFGCGGVGLSVLQGARIAGAALIIAIDLFESKRKAALDQGATHVIDPEDGDVVGQLQAITKGRGVEYTFEAIATLGTMRQAYDATCKGGTVTYVGGLSSKAELSLPANMLHLQAKRLLGSAYGSAQVRRHIPQLITLVETGRLDLGSMVTRRIGLHDVDAAFTAMEQGEVIRSVITF